MTDHATPTAPSPLTSAQRVHTALRNEQPDRVPVLEFLIDDSVARAAAPGCTDVADAMDRLGMDGVGCGARFERTEQHADGSFVDEWGVLYKPNSEAVAHPVRGPIRSQADAESWRPPDPDAPGRLGVLPDLVRRYKGRRAICFHHRAAFMWAAYLMDIDQLLMAMLAEPDLAERVLDTVLDANLRVVRNAIRAGAEVIVLGDDYAHNHGPMMSPAVFERLILPRLRRMIDLIHDEGALCIKHSDGNIYPILDLIVDAGPDGLNPIEPAAGMELGEVKRRVGDRVCLVGNIDCGQLLPHGTPGEVRDAVRRAIADAAAGGGYIVSSSNSIHSTCRPENLAAMVDAAHAFGRYAETGRTP
jgi:uroporphyrinogen decarboxylase